MNEIVIETENLTKTFGNFTAVNPHLFARFLKVKFLVF